MSVKLSAAEMAAFDKKFPEARADAAAMLAYLKGGKPSPRLVITHHPMPPDATEMKQIRQGLGLSQAQMAGLLRTPKKTYQNWEQGLRAPLGAVGLLLRLLEKKPTLVEDLRAI